MRNLHAHAPRDSARGGNGRGKEDAMSAANGTTHAKQAMLARRDFLKSSATIGAGLWIAAYVPELAAGVAESNGKVFAPHTFFPLGPDGTVTVIANSAEVGQGRYNNL